MRGGPLLAFFALQLSVAAAHACLFASNAEPADWYDWSQALFAADVTKLEEDAGKALDVITVRVVETFKGPQGDRATLKVPKRMWASCNLARPAEGAQVLVALHANGDTLLVPLAESYRARLRERKR